MKKFKVTYEDYMSSESYFFFSANDMYEAREKAANILDYEHGWGNTLIIKVESVK